MTLKRRAKTKIYFPKIIQFSEKMYKKIFLVLVGFPEISTKVCKNASILSQNIFDPNLTWPKLFSNPAYPAACASSKLLRACSFDCWGTTHKLFYFDCALAAGPAEKSSNTQGLPNIWRELN